MDGDDRGEHDFERLYVETGPGLWRALFAFTAGRRDVASDALDEAFARALAHRARIRMPVPWLYRTAFRVALGSSAGNAEPCKMWRPEQRRASGANPGSRD